MPRASVVLLVLAACADGGSPTSQASGSRRPRRNVSIWAKMVPADTTRQRRERARAASAEAAHRRLEQANDTNVSNQSEANTTEAEQQIGLLEGSGVPWEIFRLISGERHDGHAKDLSSLRPVLASAHLDMSACELPAGSGSNSGVCVEESVVQADMSFCGDAVKYTACVPADQPLWPNWNTSAKDRLIGEMFKVLVEERLKREVNVTPDEYVELRFLSNAACFTALKNVLCWYNFPKCNDQYASLPLCRSSCEQYYSACRYPADAGGVYSMCQEDSVSSSGLFDLGHPGPDQLLADFTGDKSEICERTKERYESMLEEEDIGMYWLVMTWYGIALVSVTTLVLLVLGFFLFVPYGIRIRILWITKRVFKSPLLIWRATPKCSGNTCMFLFFAVFVLLLLYGAFRRP
ncbi:unnamed protein product [Prorocentrum cordatum]|uniref:FZ domain-containing protein n=1 Tax=Prorocentrum cordatum TaxID=2364126 RepID=A0ABN9UK39_9DINO|nr:unnamed protein product [Polarella glacialis]